MGILDFIYRLTGTAGNASGEGKGRDGLAGEELGGGSR